MAFFVWKDEYSVGIKQFDHDHKKLIDLIDAIYIAMSQGKSAELITPILEDLQSYTKFHFSREEQLMAKYNYHLSAAHKKEHQAFIDKIADFNKILEQGVAPISQLLQFLKEWLTKHIMQEDKKYSDFFISKGVG